MTNKELRENTKKWPGLRDANTGKDCSDMELINGIYLSAGIPKSMVDLCFPSKSPLGQKTALWPVNEEQLDICNVMYEMAMNREPKTLIVTGGNGTGKSYLGAALVHTMIKYMVCDSARYVNEGELLLRSQSFEGNWFHQYTEICKFLVIDEFGMHDPMVADGQAQDRADPEHPLRQGLPDRAPDEQDARRALRHDRRQGADPERPAAQPLCKRRAQEAHRVRHAQIQTPAGSRGTGLDASLGRRSGSAVLRSKHAAGI